MAITIMHIHKRSLIITIIIITSSRFKRKKETQVTIRRRTRKKFHLLLNYFQYKRKIHLSLS